MTLVGTKIASASNAIDYIRLAPVAMDIGLPPTTMALPTPITTDTILYGIQIVYKLFPNCNREGGIPKVVFYVAYNAISGRNDYIVAPSLLDVFDQGAAIYAIAAGNFWGISGTYSDYELKSTSTMTLVTEGKMVAAVKKLGDSWVSALQSPSWWAQVGIAVVAGAAQMGSSAAARGAAFSEAPAVARATATMRNLQGGPITRSVRLLEKPEVFRHTVGIYENAGLRPVNLMRMQAAGEIRLSTGATAQYGEGVYAWASPVSAGTWMDMRVPAGTAAELITGPGGTFYRLVPPTGTVLKIEVVGHNLTPAQLAFAKEVLTLK